MKLIKRVYKSIRYRLAKNDWHKSAIEVAFDTYHSSFADLHEIDLRIQSDEFTFLLKNYQYAKILVEGGGIFSKESYHLYLSIQGIEIEIQTAEELFIAKEIFIDRCYEFHTLKNAVVIDVGMNVGMASLFFSKMTNVIKVYSYEPFSPTYTQAKVNIDLNPKFSDKITTHNIGWGERAEELEVDYTPTNRGRVGIMGNHLVKGKITDTRKEKMKILAASDILAPILKAEKGNTIVVKMDCEGAEFGIIEDLKSKDLLKAIDVLMMEWHIKQPEQIIDSLKRAGFRLFKFDSTTTVGMIYAIK